MNSIGRREQQGPTINHKNPLPTTTSHFQSELQTHNFFQSSHDFFNATPTLKIKARPISTTTTSPQSKRLMENDENSLQQQTDQKNSFSISQSTNTTSSTSTKQLDYERNRSMIYEKQQEKKPVVVKILKNPNRKQ